MIAQETKICSVCGLVKSNGDFSASRSGLRASCKECCRASDLRYQTRNRAKWLDSKKNYRDSNKEKLARYSRERRQAYPEIYKKRFQEWKAKNPAWWQAFYRKTRALRAGASGSFTADDIADIMRLQRGKCAYGWCAAALKKGHHIDHIIAVTKGGTNDRRNLQLLCPSCNRRKNAKDPIDFARQNGALL